jgi:hypothetical protein
MLPRRLSTSFYDIAPLPLEVDLLIEDLFDELDFCDATYITRLKRVGQGIGEYLFDKELLLKYYTYEQTKAVIKASTKVVTPGQTIVPPYLPALLKGLNIVWDP